MLILEIPNQLTLMLILDEVPIKVHMHIAFSATKCSRKEWVAGEFEVYYLLQGVNIMSDLWHIRRST